MQGKMKCGRRAGKRRIVRKHGDSENYFNCDFYSDVYCTDSSGSDAGRQRCMTGCHRRRCRDLLGKEQRSFYGRTAG